MKMVTDGDDDQCSEEGSRGEKRCLDLLAMSLGNYREEETRTVRVREEEEDRVPMELQLFGKRKIDDECKNQQNPTTYRQDYASSSSSSSSSWSLSSGEFKRRRVESQEPIKAEPLREVKPVIRGKRPVKPERWVKPEWLVNLMKGLEGVDAKLVIDKMIHKTDVNSNQGRLLIPFKQIVEMDFLNEAELHLIDEHQRDNNNNKGVAVIVVASNGRTWNAKLRRWNMNCPNYSLCSGWNDIVSENKLKDKVGQILRLWSFHSQDGTKLYLAFFHQPPAPDMAQPQCIPDLNGPFVEEMDPLEAEQERTSLESVTETSTTVDYLELGIGPRERHDRRTSVESVTESTTTLDFELGVGPRERHDRRTSVESVKETTTTLALELGLGPRERHDRRTSVESVTESTTTVDYLELGLGPRERHDRRTSVESVKETTTTLDLELGLGPRDRHDRRTSVESVTETTITWDLDLRLGRSRSVDLNIPLAPVRTEMAPLEAVQETSEESARETTRVDLEFRLGYQ